MEVQPFCPSFSHLVLADVNPQQISFLVVSRSMEKIQLQDGLLYYQHDFLDAQSAYTLYKLLQEECSWQQDRIQLFGKQHKIPRLQTFQGEPGLEYRYSNLTLQTKPWHPEVAAIKREIEQCCSSRFNAVLMNLYRDGQDSMGWHSDDEPELGQNPVIASLSLGGERRFLLRHRTDKTIAKHEAILTSGSLLIMAGSTQHYWQHSIPRTAKAVSSRINLTFRQILS